MVRRRRRSEALHIKRFTEGKSNEISFSVLDARKGDTENGVRRERKKGKMRFNGVFRPAPLSGARPLWQGFSHTKRPSASGDRERDAQETVRRDLGDVRIVSRETPFQHAAEQEIARRKARRRRRRVVSGLLGTTLLVLALGAGGYFVHEVTEAEGHNRTILQDSIRSIEETDGLILEVDELLDAEVDEDAIARLEELKAEMPETLAILTEARETASSVLNELRGAVDKEAAGHAINSAQSRETMLEEAMPIIDLMELTYRRAQEADEAWGSLLTADSLAREASSLVSDTSEENVLASIERTEDSVAEFKRAREGFVSLANQDEGLDVQPYLAYIDKRLEALDYADASNRAILIQDKATAEGNNELYNQADQEATVLAQNLQGSLSKVVYEQYDEGTEEAFANYGNARASAGTADSFLREYLGTSSK